MAHRDMETVLTHAAAELQDAAGISRRHELRLHRGNMANLTRRQGMCRFRMNEIINASAATAPVTFRNIDQFQPRHLP
jgi:hypothetical protein